VEGVLRSGERGTRADIDEEGISEGKRLVLASVSARCASAPPVVPRTARPGRVPTSTAMTIFLGLRADDEDEYRRPPLFREDEHWRARASRGVRLRATHDVRPRGGARRVPKDGATDARGDPARPTPRARRPHHTALGRVASPERHRPERLLLAPRRAVFRQRLRLRRERPRWRSRRAYPHLPRRVRPRRRHRVGDPSLGPRRPRRRASLGPSRRRRDVPSRRPRARPTRSSPRDTPRRDFRARERRPGRLRPKMARRGDARGRRRRPRTPRRNSERVSGIRRRRPGARSVRRATPQGRGASAPRGGGGRRRRGGGR